MARRITSPVMVGRATQMDVLEALLAESSSGARFVVVGGEAGIGKTRLLTELTAVARERGIPVFAGSCPVVVSGEPIPFAAITQALRSIVRSMDARSLDGHLGTTRPDLARLLPELGVTDTRSADPHDTARLFEAVLLLIERAAVPNGALLVLEDLHWADVSTWSLIGHLSRNLGATPILMAVSHRVDDGVDPWPDALRELVRLPGVERIALEPLTPADARVVLQALPDLRLSEGELATIVRRSDGIPFYLEELADHMGEQVTPMLPVSIRAAVEARSSKLSERARLLVSLVATSDGPIDVRLLRVASGWDEADVTQALREAMTAHVLVRPDGSDSHVDTRHALVREVLMAGLVPGEARRLHSMHADAVEAHLDWAGSSDAERWRRLANHLLAADERQRAVLALLRVGEAARLALAFRDADDAYRSALGIIGDGPPPLAPEPWRDVLTDAATAARLAGAPERAVVLQERVVALLGGGADEAQTMSKIRVARYQAEAGRPEVALRLLRDVAAVARTPAARARVALELARVLTARREYQDAAVEALRARDAARESGDPREAARAAAALGVALTMMGRHAEARAALSDAQRLERIGGSHGASTAGVSRPSRFPDSLLRHVDRATILASAGDPDAASRAALDGSAAARRLGVAGAWAAILAAMAARQLMRIGRWDDADEALRGALDGDGPRVAAVAAVRALLAVRRGQLDIADSALSATDVTALAETPGSGWVGVHAMASTELALVRSGFDRARSAVADGLAGSWDDAGSLQRAELASLGVRGEADAAIQARARRDAAAVLAGQDAAMVLLATGRSELARSTDPRLAPWVAALGACLDAEHHRLLGGYDPDPWAAAVTAADGTPDAFVRAYARLRLAESFLDHGRARPAATAILQECVAIARALGAVPLIEEAQRLALRARIRLDLVATASESPPSPTPRQVARGLGLSDREVDVLGLLALGLTDREIGARLFVTEKTAGHHVSHILTKLTVARRGEAAAIAHRLGLVGSSGSGPGPLT